MQRRTKLAGRGIGRRTRHIVHLSVGDHNDTGKPLARYIGQAAVQRGEQPSSVAAAAGLMLTGAHDPHIEVAFAAEPFA